MASEIRALWVDDEASEGKMETRFEDLLPLGIKVTPCLGVHEFLSLLKSGMSAYDVVVMDLIMPPRGVFPPSETARGLETGLRLVRELRTASTIPIVVITIRDRIGLGAALTNMGVSECLPKSSDLAAIAEAIRRASKGVGGGRA